MHWGRLTILVALICAFESTTFAQRKGDVLNLREGTVLNMEDGTSREVLAGAPVQVMGSGDGDIRVRMGAHFLLPRLEGTTRVICPARWAFGTVSAASAMTPTEAVMHYSTFLRSAPRDARAHFARSLAYLCDENVPASIKDCNRSIVLDDSNPNGFLHLGILCNKSLQRAEAVRAFSAAIAVCPECVLAFVERSRTYARLGRIDDGIADCDKAIDLQSDCFEAFLIRGDLHRRKGEFDAAIADLSRATTLSKTPEDSMAAYYFRGLVQFYKHDWRNALEEIDTSLDSETRALLGGGATLDTRFKDRSLLLRHRAEALSRMRDFDRALEDATLAIKIDPNNFMAYCTRGVILGKQKKYELAIADFNRGLHINTHESSLYYYRGSISFLTGHLDSAVKDFGVSIDLATTRRDKVDGFVWRAMAWMKQGNLAEAESDLSQAILLEPTRARLYSKRAAIWKELGNTGKAATDEQRARELKDAE